MAANGQRIHPAGSHRISSGPHPHAAVPAKQALDPTREHDACGFGFIAHMKGVKSHQIIRDGLAMLENLTHRGESLMNAMAFPSPAANRSARQNRAGPWVERREGQPWRQ